jgi:predicted ATPase/DNA-binding winged helix-turn-helix (wHTH) protein
MTDVLLTACRVDLARSVVHRDGEEISLTESEAKLFAYLLAHPGEALSRDRILEEAWQYASGVVSRTVDTTVLRLRAKVERDPRHPDHVLAVRGVGYQFEPTLSVAVATMHNLPPQVHRLVSQAGLLSDLDRLMFDGGRLLTLTGPAGVGKSRVALAWAQQSLPRFDEAWRVDLCGANSPEDLLNELAWAMGVTPSHEAGSLQQLTEVLRARGRVLLWLDNADPVADGLATPLATWLSATTDVVFLVTSRERLRIRRERAVDVPPLSLEEATAFFKESAEELGDGQVLETADPVQLRRLIRRLDGLPLALELAVPWVGLLPIEELNRRLDEKVAILSGGRRDGATRHTALERALDWSWDMLDASERQVLSQCACFGSRFPPELAEQLVTNIDEQVLVVLRRLKEKSLLTAHVQSARGLEFGWLETTRAYAAGKRRDKADLDLRFVQAVSLWADQHLKKWAETADWDSFHALEGGGENLYRAYQRALALHDMDHAGQLLMALESVVRLRGPWKTLARWVRRGLEVEDHPGLRRTLVRVLLDQGDLVDATNALASLTSEAPTASTMLLQARLHSVSGNLENAREVATAVLTDTTAKETDREYAHELLAWSWLNEDPQQARQLLDLQLATPQNPEVRWRRFVALAELELRAGRPSHARRWLDALKRSLAGAKFPAWDIQHLELSHRLATLDGDATTEAILREALRAAKERQGEPVGAGSTRTLLLALGQP